ncbi:hypothetical protein [Ruegeria profundi]|uniref:hypothetical protein n=1 Tax=Ruegeria profundi TaxID=1685378 RepID=UPI001CD3DE7E|nr:hypothetical protein [Ruegeria profundi]MCA0929184.1 hypothetical protein [Ruegeria profundi]
MSSDKLNGTGGQMRTGASGRVAIFWTQTEIDGLEAAPLSFLSVGAAWSWRGQARYLAEPAAQPLELGRVAGTQAAPTVRNVQIQNLPDAARGLIVLTNGAQTFTGHVFLVSGESAPILIFEGACPGRDQEFWISEFIEIENQSDEAAEQDRTIVAFPFRPTPDVGDLDPRKAVLVGRRVD